MDRASALAIVNWRYEAPYDIYDMVSAQAGEEEIEETVESLLDPRYHYYALFDQGESLVAYCCFGEDGRVPGGDYHLDALDVGMGLRPDLTGQGHGLVYIRAVLDYARQTFTPATFRVTVAQFNRRALRVWEKAGFRPVQTFQRRGDGRPFVVLVREA
jgi:RimJ/RimL family protein N-acetyltransferase